MTFLKIAGSILLALVVSTGALPLTDLTSGGVAAGDWIVASAGEAQRKYNIGSLAATVQSTEYGDVIGDILSWLQSAWVVVVQYLEELRESKLPLVDMRHAPVYAHTITSHRPSILRDLSRTHELPKDYRLRYPASLGCCHCCPVPCGLHPRRCRRR